MKAVEVKARDGKDANSKECVINVQMPENIEEAIQVFGGESILSNALANWTVGIQSGVRRYLRAGKTQAEIQSLMGNAKMGVALERVSDPRASMLAKFAVMTPEERAAFIKELQAKAKAS